jgi:ketosteroid isomerase-like protein
MGEPEDADPPKEWRVIRVCVVVGSSIVCLAVAVPQEDIDAIQAEYAAMSRMDWPEVFREAHPDFEFKPPEGGMAGGRVTQGRDKARADIESFFAPFEEVQLEAEEFHERGDYIAVYLTMRTRPKGSSAMIKTRLGQLWMMREGRLARLEIHPQPEKALRAAERALEPAKPWE